MDLWALILAIASAVVLLANASEKIVKAIKLVRSPSDQQNKRLDALEAWQEGVNRKLDNDYARLNGIEEGNRVTQKALLALLDHALDGNNVDQMRSAKEELRNHLINR